MEDLKTLTEKVRKELYAVVDKQAEVIAQVYLEIYDSLPEEFTGKDKEDSFQTALKFVYSQMYESAQKLNMEWARIKDSPEFKQTIEEIANGRK